MESSGRRNVRISGCRCWHQGIAARRVRFGRQQAQGGGGRPRPAGCRARAGGPARRLGRAAACRGTRAAAAGGRRVGPGGRLPEPRPQRPQAPVWGAGVRAGLRRQPGADISAAVEQQQQQQQQKANEGCREPAACVRQKCHRLCAPWPALWSARHRRLRTHARALPAGKWERGAIASDANGLRRPGQPERPGHRAHACAKGARRAAAACPVFTFSFHALPLRHVSRHSHHTPSQHPQAERLWTQLHPPGYADAGSRPQLQCYILIATAFADRRPAATAAAKEAAAATAVVTASAAPTAPAAAPDTAAGPAASSEAARPQSAADGIRSSKSSAWHPPTRDGGRVAAGGRICVGAVSCAALSGGARCALSRVTSSGRWTTARPRPRRSTSASRRHWHEGARKH